MCDHEYVRNGFDMLTYCTLLHISQKQYGMIPVLEYAVAGLVVV